MKNAHAFLTNGQDYAKWRPQYPASLFAWLAAQSPQRKRALDCATGNGQAALGCAQHFAQVIGIDFSLGQLQARLRHPRVHYAAAAAEALPFPDRHFDLVTVALAIHWFDLPRFYREVERVLRPGGVLAAWGYAFPRISPRLDALIQQHLLTPIAPYWDQRNHIVASRYRALPLPYPPLPPPKLEDIMLQWTRAQLLAYFSTWSAVRRCRAEDGGNPLPGLDAALAAHWPDGESRTIRLPLFIRAARKPR